MVWQADRTRADQNQPGWNVHVSSKLASQARRRFLGRIGATAIAGLAPGLHLIAVSQAAPVKRGASTRTRWGMLIDSSRCARDCDACVAACQDEHGLKKEKIGNTDAQWIGKVSLTDGLTKREITLPLMCQHCANPPCVDVCPTGASFKRADGIVLVDKHRCIGCRYCMMACPFNARSFIHESISDQKTHAPRGKGTVESCTLCVHRVDSGITPACVEACGGSGKGAMLFGDLNDPGSAISIALRTDANRAMRADLNLDAAIRYRGV